MAEAEFVRYGVIHRNTFLNSPKVLLPTYQSRARSDLFFAGQITGVEGYVESAGAGLIAGINAARLAKGQEPVTLPLETMLGSLANYVTAADPKHFQPMNANFGLLPPLPMRIRDKDARKEAQSQPARSSAWRRGKRSWSSSPSDRKQQSGNREAGGSGRHRHGRRRRGRDGLHTRGTSRCPGRAAGGQENGGFL